MDISICLSQSIALVLPSFGGDTVLVRTARWIERQGLESNEDVQHCVWESGFADIIDWLLCGIYPEYYDDCMAFYRGDGGSFESKCCEYEITDIDRDLASRLRYKRMAVLAQV